MTARTQTSLGLPLASLPAGSPVSPALSGTVRILAVGDSITVGYPNTDGWKQRVGEMLTGAGIAYQAVGHVNSTAANWPNMEAVSGETIADHITNFNANPTAKLVTPDPDIIIVAPLGNNDLGSVDAATTASRMTTLLEIFRNFTNARGRSPRIVAMYCFNKSLLGNEHEAYNALLPGVWAAQRVLGQTIVTCDARPAVSSPAASGLRADGNHPSEPGYRAIAQVVWPALLDAIGVSRRYAAPLT